MARRFEDMSEQEAREELARRNHPREAAPYDDPRAGWLGPMGYGPGEMFRGFGWPFLPPAYPEAGYGPYARPGDPRRRDRMIPHGGGRDHYGRESRDFFDRAGDEVASWFGDDAAEARREADHRGRGPKGYVRSDARIEEDIHDRLTDDPYLDAREITVTVADREITLDGTVDSRRAKRHAEDCADSISGVTHVQNNLRVQATA